MRLLHTGDAVGLVCCSNGQEQAYRAQNEALAEVLRSLGLRPVFGRHIYAGETVRGGSARERAADLMAMVRDPAVRAIFDLSGGDLANGVLEYLDYDEIRAAKKPFCGYSDLTCVLNALYARAGTAGYLYAVKNLVYADGARQTATFADTFLSGGDGLLRADYRFLQGRRMQGVVVGGNLRCLLKLAGTPYLPDFQDKVLFLESRGGDVARTAAGLTQLRQMGVFRSIRGLYLGAFTTLDASGEQPPLEALAREIVDDPSLPMARTAQIGHGADARALPIGMQVTLRA